MLEKRRRNLRTLLLVVLSGAACAHAGAGQSPLRFTPEAQGRRQVMVEAPDHGLRWRLRIPERVFCDEGVLVGHDIRAVHTPVQWVKEDSGDLVYRRDNRDDTSRPKLNHEIAYQLRITPTDFGAGLQLTFENTGDEKLHNLTGHVCLGHRSEPFRDPDFERSFMRHKGAFLNLGRTGRGDNTIRTHYRIEGYRPIKIFANPNNRFWGPLAPEVADNGLILTRSDDGRYLMALWFEPSSELFHNCDESNMCIHSDPHYGDLAPGESLTVNGRLILFEGGLEAFAAEYLE